MDLILKGHPISVRSGGDIASRLHSTRLPEGIVLPLQNNQHVREVEQLLQQTTVMDELVSPILNKIINF